MVIDRFGGEHENYILYLLEIHKRMSNSDLCRALNLSTSTVRKKLAKMEEEGLLIRTYGGAASLDADRDETIGRKSQMNIQQKRMIAAAASRFVRDGETISLGGGSTVAELCTYFLHLKKAIILTDSTVIANLLTKNKGLEVHINGGIVRERTGCVVGPSSDQLFQRYYTDKAFLGCDSFSGQKGIGSDNILVGRVEQTMFQYAKERYILCDSTKLGQDALFSYAKCSEVTALITDHDANPEHVAALRERGLTVIVAPAVR